MASTDNASSTTAGIDTVPQRQSASALRYEHDAGRPPGPRRRDSRLQADRGTAAALGFCDRLPSLSTNPQHPSGPVSPVDMASRALTRPTVQRTESTTLSTASNMPYSSWSSAPTSLRPEARHGNSRVFSFMPSSGRVPIPPPLRSPPGSPLDELPPSPAMHRRVSSTSSVTTSPSGETYFTFSNATGDTFFSSRSNATSSSRRTSSDDTASDQTSPPPATPAAKEDFGAHNGAMSSYEPRALAESDLTNASIGRTVDEALTALLGATKLVQAGLGSAALVIGPVEGRDPRERIDREELLEEDWTRRPLPPHAEPRTGLISFAPGDRPPRRLTTSSMNAQPRAIKATVVPPMRVVRSPQ